MTKSSELVESNLDFGITTCFFDGYHTFCLSTLHLVADTYNCAG